MLASGSRDDGIAFYVPKAASSTTKQVYSAEDPSGLARYYFSSDPEAAARSTKVPAFFVASAAAKGTLPLMRVFYLNQCGWSHDELAVGQERFNRIYKQGDALPLWSAVWTGIKEPTTLVVEALDSGCPYQGFFAPTSLPAVIGTYGNETIFHEPYVTLDQLRAASPTTEVFLNGQHGPAWVWQGGNLVDGMQPQSPPPPPLPKALRRSFVKVAPNPHPKMDFFADFSTPEVFTKAKCDLDPNACEWTLREQSPSFDKSFIYVERIPNTDLLPVVSTGTVLGEFWVAYADQSADTNGKFRLTANQKATMSADLFLHVTMQVDMVSTSRRYPQILISDRPAPVQDTLEQGHTLIVQPRGDWPVGYQLQVCNMRTWDVNNQCPDFEDTRRMNRPGGPAGQLAPVAELGELGSPDHRAVFDVYASTKRVYLFLEGQPYTCADMPSGSLPSGSVTVTWGDVLYHSGADGGVFAFQKAHLQVDTRRHFDNLGFSSGVPAPGWDENAIPCLPSSALVEQK